MQAGRRNNTPSYKRALVKGFIKRPAEHTLIRHNLLEWWKEHLAAQSTQTEAPAVEPVEPVEPKKKQRGLHGSNEPAEPGKKRRKVLHGSPV
jgi:hypothetical protein